MKHRFIYIYSAFVVSLSILVLLSLLAFQQLDTMSTYNPQIDNAYKGLFTTRSLNIFMTQLESGARGYLLTSDSSYLEPFRNHKIVIKKKIDSLSTSVEDESMRNKLAMLNSSVKLSLNSLYLLINNVHEKDSSLEVEFLQSSKDMMARLKYELGNFEKQQLQILEESFRKKEFYEKVTPRYLKMVMFFTCFIIITSFFFLDKALRQRLRYQHELENKVDELHRSNEELEQLAHVASHDLQEPLRKLRTFTSRLLLKHSEKLDEEVKLILSRIEVSAVSMQELINDVVIFTNLTHSSESPSQVDLNDAVAQVLGDFQSQLEAKGVQVRKDHLPAIQGYPKQLYLLFKSLIENSLKFTRQNVTPLIEIKVHKTSIKNRDFHKISVEDNGIGFENMFNEKIFIIFQRLHGQQSKYQGKGIGLAIAKRVVINHNGTILATGKPENGAVFEIYLPV